MGDYALFDCTFTTLIAHSLSITKKFDLRKNLTAVEIELVFFQIASQMHNHHSTLYICDIVQEM